jgi:hypothetical protein
MREEHRLRVFKHWVLRKIFGLKKDIITAGLHKGELHDLYSSPNIIITNHSKNYEMGGVCGNCGRDEGCKRDFGAET